jgi:hypothetical protein
MKRRKVVKKAARGVIIVIDFKAQIVASAVSIIEFKIGIEISVAVTSGGCNKVPRSSEGAPKPLCTRLT